MQVFFYCAKEGRRWKLKYQYNTLRPHSVVAVHKPPGQYDRFVQGIKEFTVFRPDIGGGEAILTMAISWLRY